MKHWLGLSTTLKPILLYNTEYQVLKKQKLLYLYMNGIPDTVGERRRIAEVRPMQELSISQVRLKLNALEVINTDLQILPSIYPTEIPCRIKHAISPLK